MSNDAGSTCECYLSHSADASIHSLFVKGLLLVAPTRLGYHTKVSFLLERSLCTSLLLMVLVPMTEPK
jgi:hypothetical protein